MVATGRKRRSAPRLVVNAKGAAIGLGHAAGVADLHTRIGRLRADLGRDAFGADRELERIGEEGAVARDQVADFNHAFSVDRRHRAVEFRDRFRFAGSGHFFCGHAFEEEARKGKFGKNRAFNFCLRPTVGVELIEFLEVAPIVREPLVHLEPPEILAEEGTVFCKKPLVVDVIVDIAAALQAVDIERTFALGKDLVQFTAFGRQSVEFQIVGDQLTLAEADAVAVVDEPGVNLRLPEKRVIAMEKGKHSGNPLSYG